VSLSHLVREAALKAIMTGTERIDKPLLDSIELDHAATEEQAAAAAARGKKKRPGKPR
jgi:hypothetical protein